MGVWYLAAGIVLAAAIYLWLIMPRIFNRPSREPFMHYFYAHRGFHDNQSDAPENSLKAFRCAAEMGYGIELDVQLSKDRVPVVFHDDTLKRVCGVEGRVSDFTYDKLKKLTLFESKETIPRFEEVLRLVNGRVPLVVEIKCQNGNTEVCEYVYPYLVSYKGAYCIESFHPMAVRWFRKMAPGTVRGQLSSNLTKSGGRRFSMFCLSHLLFNFLVRPDFIAYNCRYKEELSQKLCRRLFGAFSIAWTVKSKKQLEKIKKDYDLFIFEGFRPKE